MNVVRVLWPMLSMLVGFAALRTAVRFESYVLLVLGLALALIGVLAFTRPVVLHLPRRRAAAKATPR